MKISIYNVKDEPIGRGGMGQVYLGSDAMGNKVAIKEMLAQYVLDGDLRARFHQEIHILNKLEHPSIVKMYASFEERGNLYLVMEYVEGETIEQYIKRRGVIEESEAIRIMSDVLSALGYAHQKGYVHRDIKPSNIMIRNNGNVCLLDFGIAKDMNRKNSQLTVGQLTIGTDGYMSPEQAEGYNIDHRSDIYSLGCVLFFMLTGRHAVQKQSSDVATRMFIIQNDFPKAISFNFNLSNKIQRVLDKATQKNMLMRFQSCREFDLEMSSGETAVDNNFFDGHVVSIGREGCDIVISHPKISRRHLDVVKEITSEGELYTFRDRSTNGTMINEKKIHNSETTWSIHYENQFGSYRTIICPTILLAGEIDVVWTRIEEAFFMKEQGTSKPQSISPNPYLENNSLDSNPPKPASTYEPSLYPPKSATGWLVAIYIFAVLGGLFGLAFGIFIYNSKVEFANGRKIHKYKASHRTAALIGAVLSCVSLFIWKIILT